MPTRHELDPVSPDNPVFIPAAAMSSRELKALQLAGIMKESRTPGRGHRGGREGRDADLLLENAVTSWAGTCRRRLEHAGAVEVRDGRSNSYAIVGVVEPGVTSPETGALCRGTTRATSRAHRRAYLAMRKADVREASRRVEAQKTRLSPSSGSSARSTALEGGGMAWPYRFCRANERRGLSRRAAAAAWRRDEYVAGLKLGPDAGLQAQTDAVGDETIDVIVPAYEPVNKRKPIRPPGLAYDHLFHPSDAALAKMADDGIVATMQDHPVLARNNQCRWWGDEHAAYAIPIGKTIDAGVLVGGGTDGPVVPLIGRVDAVDDDAPSAQGLRARQGNTRSPRKKR